MSQMTLRPGLLALAIALGPLTLLPALAAGDITASSAVQRFDLPAGPLGETLSRISRQGGHTLSVNPALLEGKRATAVRGEFTPEQAARQALGGSGLGLGSTSGGTWSLYPLNEGAALNLAPTAIDGRGLEDGRGPVAGYVATRSATATKTDTPILEIPQAVNVVTAAQVQTQGARNLTQALRYTPGLGTNGYSDRNTIADEIGSRGFAPTLLYLDGAYLPYAGSLGGAPQIDPYLLERIEVLKGPASVLYGQNQPGGMINLVSKRPGTEDHHQVKLSYGSYDRVKGAFDVGGALDTDKTLSYRLVGLAKSGNEQVEHADESRTLIAPSLTWAPNEQTEFTAYAQIQRDKGAADYQALPVIGTLYRNSRGQRIDRDVFLGDSDWNAYTRDQQVFGYDLSHVFNDNLKFRQSARYIDVNDRYRGFYLNRFVTDVNGVVDDTRATRTKLDWRQHNTTYTLDNNLQGTFSTGALEHTLLGGVDYRKFTRRYQGYNLYNAEIIDLYNPTNYHTNGVPTLTTKWDNTVRQTGLYLQDQIRFDHFILTLGGRQDWAEVENRDLLAQNPAERKVPQKDKKFTKRVGLTYVTEFGLAPYVSYAESFMPSVGKSSPARGARSFKPIEGEQYEVGVKYQPQDNTLITASVYQIKQKNVLTADRDDPMYQTQDGEIRSRGIELEAKSSVGQLDLLLALSYLDSFRTKSADGDEGNRNEAQAPWSASSWVAWHLDDSLTGLTVGAGARYTGKNYGDSANTFKTPSFVVYDATVNYDLAQLGLKGLQASLNVQNLFDREYVSTCVYAFGCYYGQERTAALELTYDW